MGFHGEGVAKPRKKKTESINLHDVLRSTSREAAAQERIGGYIHDPDDASDDEPPNDTADADAATDAAADGPTFTSEELLERVGPYTPKANYRVVHLSAVSPEAWSEQLKTYSWKGRRVAHIFEGGWADASYVRPTTPKEEKREGFYVFYYKDVGEYLKHNLRWEEYGMTKSWVIIEPEKKTTAR